MSTCTRCGSEAKPDVKFCAQCGSSLGQRLCANGHVMEPDWARCKYCPPPTNPSVETASTPTRVIKPTSVVLPLKPTTIESRPLQAKQSPKTQLYVKAETASIPRLIGWLVIAEGKNQWKDYRVTDKQMLLGRDHDCDVVIDDAHASARHASLRLKDGEVLLTDLDSGNGTLVNGVSISRVELADGAEVKIGETVLKFKRL